MRCGRCVVRVQCEARFGSFDRSDRSCLQIDVRFAPEGNVGQRRRVAGVMAGRSSVIQTPELELGHVRGFLGHERLRCRQESDGPVARKAKRRY